VIVLPPPQLQCWRESLSLTLKQSGIGSATADPWENLRRGHAPSAVGLRDRGGTFGPCPTCQTPSRRQLAHRHRKESALLCDLLALQFEGHACRNDHVRGITRHIGMQRLAQSDLIFLGSHVLTVDQHISEPVLSCRCPMPHVSQIWLPKPVHSYKTDPRVRLIRISRFIGPRSTTYGMTARTVAVNSACSGFSPRHSTNW